ncbi:hypothetical protein CJ195_12135 [Bacillus sp. UMB0899]|nr:hypothetical protein CJ195_12135 [Bacillus sp. UMB0899]
MNIVRGLFNSGIYFYKNEPKLASIATDFLTIKNQKLKKEILGDSQKASRSFFHNLIDERKASGEISKEIDTEMLLFLINTINTSYAEYFLENVDLGFDNEELVQSIDKMLLILQYGIGVNTQE